jgi:hypothetical protein
MFYVSWVIEEAPARCKVTPSHLYIHVMEVNGYGKPEPLAVRAHGIEFSNAICTFGELNAVLKWAGVHESIATVALGRATRAVADVSSKLYWYLDHDSHGADAGHRYNAGWTIIQRRDTNDQLLISATLEFKLTVSG